MALFYNNTQGVWPGLPQLARPFPQGNSQQFSGMSPMGAGNTPMMQGPVTPPPQASNMRKATENNWTGLPPIPKYGR